MEALQDIQEIIDENKDTMPTGAVKALYDKSKEAIENFPKLYKLAWTMVDSHAHVVEVEDEPTLKTRPTLPQNADAPGQGSRTPARSPQWVWWQNSDHGFSESRHGIHRLGGAVDHFAKQPSVPMVLMPCDSMSYGRTDCMVIVNSIEPYREREE